MRVSELKSFYFSTLKSKYLKRYYSERKASSKYLRDKFSLSIIHKFTCGCIILEVESVDKMMA